MTLSQFYIAVGPHGAPHDVATNIGHGTTMISTAIINQTPEMTGWSEHPQALFLLPILSAAFYYDWNFGVW
jgi:hypothetical protein